MHFVSIILDCELEDTCFESLFIVLIPPAHYCAHINAFLVPVVSDVTRITLSTPQLNTSSSMSRGTLQKLYA